MRNFRQAQRKAKQNVTKLLLLFFVASFLFVGVCSAVLYITSGLSPSTTAPLIFLTILIGSFYQSSKLKGGGSVVARELGAREISPLTKDINEKKFLNIVEEVAIASSTPIPTAYILEDESINAFVSGISSEDMIICTTKGAIEKLNREELQGVVGHEFGHIFNEDVKLNVKVASMIFGFYSLVIVGRFFLHTHIGSRKDDKMGSVAIGFVLMALGIIGSAIGSIINAGISRQKEYLADASAVQYTRNPLGISGALKKIGYYSGAISSPNSELYNHFYLADEQKKKFNLFSIFATHPPLEDRIYTLEPDWDGKYDIKENRKAKPKKPPKTQEDKFKEILKTATVLETINEFSPADEKNIDSAKDDLGSISEKLKTMSNEPLSSQALILALLAKDFNEVSSEQLKRLMNINPKLYRLTLLSSRELIELKPENYLNLILLCTASLKQMSLNQYLDFKEILIDWIYENGEVVFFEWLIQRIVLQPLDVYFKVRLPRVKKFGSLNEQKSQIEYFISFLCVIEDEKNSEQLFYTIINRYNYNEYRFTQIQTKDYEKLGLTLDSLVLLDINLRNKILKLAFLTLNEDKILDAKNRQMLYAISLALKVPLPYM